jgi:hypothetical protein
VECIENEALTDTIASVTFRNQTYSFTVQMISCMANCLFSHHNPLQEHLLIWIYICSSQSFYKIKWKVNTLVTFALCKAEEIRKAYISFVNATTNIKYRRNYDPEQIQPPHPMDFMTGIANEIVLNLASNFEGRSIDVCKLALRSSYHPIFRKCSIAQMIY